MWTMITHLVLAFIDAIPLINKLRKVNRLPDGTLTIREVDGKVYYPGCYYVLNDNALTIHKDDSLVAIYPNGSWHGVTYK